MVLNKNLPKTGGTNKSTFPEIQIRIEKGTRNTNSSTPISEQEVYERFRSGRYEIQQTELIHKELNAHNKKTDRYATLKGELYSCTFGFSENRSEAGDVKYSTNLINLDLDEDSKEVLIAARERIQSGEFPFIRSCGASPSNPLEGSFWANCYIEVNTFDIKKHKSLAKLIGVNKDSSSRLIFDNICSAYVKWIKELLKEAANIKFSKRSLKQPRYICFDENLYVNDCPEMLTLSDLEVYLEQYNKEVGEAFEVSRSEKKSKSNSRRVLNQLSKANGQFLNITFPITDIDTIVNNTLNWAENIGRELIPNQQGNRNETLMVQSKAMAKFGVPIEVWLKYCIDNYVYVGDLKVSAFTEQEINQVVSSSYNAVLRNKSEGRLFYADNDAIQEMLYYVESDNKDGIEEMRERFQIRDIEKTIQFFKDNLVIPCETFHLNKGEYLSDRAVEIDALLQKHKKIELIAGTGVGKSYLSNSKDALAKLFCARKGEKARVVIIDSLNIKAKSDAETYDNFGYTGEILRENNIGELGYQTEGNFLKTGISENRIIVTNQMKIDDLIVGIQETFATFKDKDKRIPFPNEDTPILFIVDEVQSLVKRFRIEGIRKIMDVINEMNSESEVIFQTGTPKDYWHSQGFHRVRFTNERGNINVDLRKRSDKFEADLLELIEEFPKDKNLLIVKYNDKDAIDRAFELFTENDWLKEEEIVCIYSGNSKEQKAKYEKRLLNRIDGQDSFDDKVHLVLATSAIQEGLDIYCETRNAITINFERKGIFEWDALVQYLDRVRVSSTTNKRALFYVGNAEMNNKGFNGFIPKLEYEQTYKDLLIQAEAQTLETKGEICDSYLGRKVFKRQIGDITSGELTKWSDKDNKYIPDVVELVCFLESVHASRCTIREGFSYIERHFPYIKFNKKSYIESSKIDSEIMVKINEAEQRSKELRDSAAKRFKTMLLANSDLAIQTIVCAAPKDVGIRVNFGKVNNVHYNNAKSIIKNSPDLYAGREFQYIQEIGLNFKRLTEGYYLSKESAIAVMFKDDESFSKAKINRFREEAAIQYEIICKEIIEAEQGEIESKSKAYQRIERELGIINKLEFEKALTRNELIDSVKTLTRSKKNLKTMSGQDCIDFVNRYCIVEDSRTKFGRFKTIKGLKDFDAFTDEYNIQVGDKELIKQLIGIEISGEEATTDVKVESYYEAPKESVNYESEWSTPAPF